jgi:TonB family protein
MLMLLAKRQRLFMEDVGIRKAGPAVVGFFYPHIVTPADFSHRFSDQERKLILAHEQVHLERQDVRINALATLVRCLCWFNPLVHIGARRLRADQELSCDAAVIERRPRARRAYAETLLKTQLADRPLPVGCYWPPEAAWATSHPLTERIAMLTASPLSHPRRLAAATAVLALVGGGGFAAWAAQPAHLVLVPEDDRPGRDIMVPFEPLAPDDRVADPETLTLILPSGRDAADNPTPAPQTKIYSPSDPGVTRPRMSKDNAFPDYPTDSLALREEGDVVATLCVSASGKAQVQRIERSSGSPRLDQATLAGLPNMKFEPGMHEGAPVDMCGYMLTMRWTLPVAAPATEPASTP